MVKGNPIFSMKKCCVVIVDYVDDIYYFCVRRMSGPCGFRSRNRKTDTPIYCTATFHHQENTIVATEYLFVTLTLAIY